jgi:hypothetical protein
MRYSLALDYSCQPKISEQDKGIVRIRLHQDVFRLYIAMGDTTLVKIIDCQAQLKKDEASLVLCNPVNGTEKA